jgi:predicted nucleic acid-binding protein
MLVDTSVWINHFRRANPDLEHLLDQGDVLTHPFVIGELASGVLTKRSDILKHLAALPTALAAAHEEAMALVERHRLAGTGLGWIDVHLLASAKLSRLSLWIADRRLRQAAIDLGLAGPAY